MYKRCFVIFVLSAHQSLTVVHHQIVSDTDGLYYTHKDYLQSTLLTTDSGGIVEEAVDYNPFGSERNRAGPHESDFSYNHQERDTETGLMYYDARYYSPELKRFTSIDPAVLRLGTVGSETNQLLANPQQQNAYTYVANSPVKYNDPSGEVLQFFARAATQFAKGVATYGAWGGASGAVVQGLDDYNEGSLSSGPEYLDSVKDGAIVGIGSRFGPTVAVLAATVLGLDEQSDPQESLRVTIEQTTDEGIDKALGDMSKKLQHPAVDFTTDVVRKVIEINNDNKQQGETSEQGN